MQSMTDRSVDSTSLLCEDPWVTPENRNDGRAQSDSGNFLANDGQGCQRVKAEEIGNPEAGCTDLAGLVCRKGHIWKTSPVDGHVEDAKFHEILLHMVIAGL